MHEYAITESILSLALEKAEEAKATRLTRINLTIGDLSGIVDESITFYFDFLSKDTKAAGARLSFDKKPVVLRCRTCQADFTPPTDTWACPQCRKVSLEIISGRECYMESIEVE